MHKELFLVWFAIIVALLPLSVYSRHYSEDGGKHRSHHSHGGSMPSKIPAMGEKVIIVNPNIHRFGAYSADGTLLRSGTATSGAHYCPDIRRGCRTPAGTFRIWSLGNRGCRSTRYPVGRGGAPMPYCMFFSKYHALHGSYQVVNGNISHGCVRLHVDDAEWIRFNFAHVGTKVIIKSY